MLPMFRKRKQQQQDKSSDVRERDSWSVSDDGFDNDNGDEEDDDLDDDEDDLENDESGMNELGHAPTLDCSFHKKVV